MQEAAAMRGGVSPAMGRRYPLTMICAVFRVSRSTVYRTTAPAVRVRPVAEKRGPKTRWSDADVVAAIRAMLAATSFHGEGYRKIRARLAHRGPRRRLTSRSAQVRAGTERNSSCGASHTTSRGMLAPQ